jgi:hypothetical protein
MAKDQSESSNCSGLSSSTRAWKIWKKILDFESMDLSAGKNQATVETDIVRTRSSCGGSAMAKTLAEGGQKVLVADKGLSFST